MSEGFDKEAERERLRKKYEADREDREATERMSELLLQGATMTNKHCDTCGSPIFRYDGQEFCPNCQYEAQAQAGADAETQATDAETQATDAETQATDAETQAADAKARAAEGQAGSETETAVRTEDTAAEQPPEVDQGEWEDTRVSGGEDESQQTREGSPGTHAGEQPSGHDETMATPTEATVETAEGTSSEEAADALLATITTLARRAAQSSDPRRAKDLLAAAHEAAATLETLRGRD